MIKILSTPTRSIEVKEEIAIHRDSKFAVLASALALLPLQLPKPPPLIPQEMRKAEARRACEEQARKPQGRSSRIAVAMRKVTLPPAVQSGARNLATAARRQVALR